MKQTAVYSALLAAFQPGVNKCLAHGYAVVTFVFMVGGQNVKCDHCLDVS